ncbi:MAG: N-acetylneuraminate synthase family protein [Pirellulaceae bacterium]
MRGEIRIGNLSVGAGQPCVFIADIGANHDGNYERAVSLIHQAAAASADIVKFQHFRADHIVSQFGFDSLKMKLSHQHQWKQSVYDVYKSASLSWEWTESLAEVAREVGIEFMSTPYDLAAVDHLDTFVPAYKVGSGDIPWDAMLLHVASKNKPILLATGASSIGEVQHAADLILEQTTELILMQCNTNYTGASDNFEHVHLNVLKTYRAMYPDCLLGLSDHTPGHAAVLGAIALGAVAIEKHFTDDTTRVGPDHGFALDPIAWREMVDRSRELEAALGCGRKFVAENEEETVIVQRRCLRAARPMDQGHVLREDDIDVLRPSPPDGIEPNRIEEMIGKPLRRSIEASSHLTWDDIA